jgi:AcrR family transcriptional regulator
MPLAARSREDAILAAAAELFAAHGYAAVGIDDIGAAVGVSGPAVYRYFPGKEALLAALVVSTADTLAEAFGPFESLTAEPDESLLRQIACVALDHRPGLATMMREQGRLSGSDALRVVEASERVAELTRRAVQWANPHLDPLAVQLRASAAAGASLAVVSGRAASVPRPRLDEMLVSSSRAVFAVPMVCLDDPAAIAARQSIDRARRWMPQPTRTDIILRAALRLFRQTSFHDVGVEDIGAAAQVPTRAIYRHYRSKLDILIDAYERAGHRLGAALVRALEDAPTAAAAVDRLADRVALLAMRDLDLTVVTSRENRALPKDDRPHHLRAFTAVNSVWRQALAETRPELPAAEVGLLVDTVLPAIHTAAAQAEGHPERTPEIAAIARAHLHS